MGNRPTTAVIFFSLVAISNDTIRSRHRAETRVHTFSSDRSVLITANRRTQRTQVVSVCKQLRYRFGGSSNDKKIQVASKCHILPRYISMTHRRRTILLPTERSFKRGGSCVQNTYFATSRILSKISLSPLVSRFSLLSFHIFHPTSTSCLAVAHQRLPFSLPNYASLSCPFPLADFHSQLFLYFSIFAASTISLFFPVRRKQLCSTNSLVHDTIQSVAIQSVTIENKERLYRGTFDVREGLLTSLSRFSLMGPSERFLVFLFTVEKTQATVWAAAA